MLGFHFSIRNMFENMIENCVSLFSFSLTMTNIKFYQILGRNGRKKAVLLVRKILALILVWVAVFI